MIFFFFLWEAGVGANEDSVDRVMCQERVPSGQESSPRDSFVLPFTVLRKDTHCLPVYFCNLAQSCQALWKCPGPGCMALGKSFSFLGLSLPSYIMGEEFRPHHQGFPRAFIL